MATYEKGDRDEEVARFQRKLGVTADGIFGPETQAAVKAWQKANGQKADGMVGPDMLLALGVDELIILEDGDEGELVRRVQALLSLETDGEYGKATVRAVRGYQKTHGLKASGNADPKTLKAMGVLDAAKVKAPSETRRATEQAPHARPSPAPQSVAGAIRSWAYQLADIKPKKIADLAVDLVVIDYAADGDDESAFKPQDVARMKGRPDGRTKKLIAYMSIGEAEDYRYYWRKAWKKKETRPAWLDAENRDWGGNFKVRFWDPEWQAIILGSGEAYLDRIIAAGFDGVYLDIIDAFEYWRDEKRERPDADKDMIGFVKRIAEYARARRPGFMIIPQNGEALLEDASYRAAISAQAKEDIFFGIDGDGRANQQTAIAECTACLQLASRAGLPILAVEYLDDAMKIADARERLAAIGSVAYFGPRDLDKINADGVSAA